MNLLAPELTVITARQQGAIAIRTLTAAGLRMRAIHRLVDSGLWQQPTSRVVVTTPAAITRSTDLWIASLHFDDFGLAGASALELRGFPAPSSGEIHLVGPRGGWHSRLPHWRLHSATDIPLLVDEAPLRVPIELAVVQAMRWARSIRQAVFFAVWALQRSLVDLEQLQQTVVALPPSPTCSMAKKALRVVDPGVHSMNEFDFARECRRRGLPEPARQVRRLDGRGCPRYLDAEFRLHGQSLVVEIDGLGHLDAKVQIDDQFRANELTLQNSRVLRIPAVALRIDADRFYGQLAQALRQMLVAA